MKANLIAFFLGFSVPAALTSCLTTVAPDGTRTRRVDPEAGRALIGLARDLYVPRPLPVDQTSAK